MWTSINKYYRILSITINRCRDQVSSRVGRYGRPTWVEGRVDEEVVHQTDSTVQQQTEKATELFRIPRIFKPEQWQFLQTSEADLARGAVEAIKCRLCPKSQLKNFEELLRAARLSKAAPRSTTPPVPQSRPSKGRGEAPGYIDGAQSLQ
jgi:hypothetical protein